MATNSRARESRRHRFGSGGMSSRNPARLALGGLLDLARIGKKPKPMSHAHRHNVRDYVEAGLDAVEVRYVLMDYEKGEQLKAKMMTRLEAWKRNESLRGSGFAWAMCSR